MQNKVFLKLPYDKQEGNFFNVNYNMLTSVQQVLIRCYNFFKCRETTARP